MDNFKNTIKTQLTKTFTKTPRQTNTIKETEYELETYLHRFRVEFYFLKKVKKQRIPIVQKFSLRSQRV